MGLPSIDVNLVSVLVAAVISVVFGGLWYSSILFGNIWIKQMGFTKKEMKKASEKSRKKYFVTFIGSVITAYILAYLIYFMGVGRIFEGAMLGLLIWVGFIVPLSVGAVLWEGKSMKLFFINIFYWAINLILMGIILTVWR